MPFSVNCPPPRPRVIHVITHLDMGGAEGVAMSLIEQLRSEIDFALFAVMHSDRLSAVGQDMSDRLTQWGVPIFTGTARGFKTGGVLVAAHAIEQAMRHFKPDIVHLHTEIPELTYVVAMLTSARLRRVPVIRTVHNVELWIKWGAIGRWVTERLSDAQAVAVSHAAARADAAIRTHRQRPMADVVHNGVAVPPTAADRSTGGPVHLLFAGRLVQQKGADLLPAILDDAWRRTTVRDVKVTIAGSGAMHDMIARAIGGLAPGWTVTLTPPIGGLSGQLDNYDGLILPSRFEGFGLLALEALLAGLPIVTTDAPGLDEVVPLDYPLRAPVDDVGALAGHVVRMIEDNAQCRRIAYETGALLASKFSVTAMAHAYGRRYRALKGADA